MRRALATAFAAALLLGACTHARVVQREPSGRPPPARSQPRPAVSPVPRDGTHVVRAGETLYGISFRYGLRYQDVAAWNGIADPYLIEIGQRLRLKPGGQGSARASTSPSSGTPPPRTAPTTSTNAPTASSAPAPSQAPPATAPRAPSGAPPATAAIPAASAPPPMPAPIVSANAPGWRWPTKGEIVGRYVAGDQTRQGIDIAGSAGQDVQAAADGVVVYSGAGLVGYGELIIVKHSEEWLSAYAHNQQRLVNEGARVGAGQVIARMGRTGAPRDMLHFEIRRNGKPVDPLALLPRR
jgi:lipoprotein NlpD